MVTEIASATKCWQLRRRPPATEMRCRQKPIARLDSVAERQQAEAELVAHHRPYLFAFKRIIGQ